MRESEGEVVTVYKNKTIEYFKLEENENKILKENLKSLIVEKFSDTVS